MDKQKYLDEIHNMICGAPGHRSTTLRNYLALCEATFGERFDPIRALDDLIEISSLLRSEIKRKAI